MIQEGFKININSSDKEIQALFKQRQGRKEAGSFIL